MKKYRAVLVIGKPGSGKSTWIKKRLKRYKGNKLIMDINNEYEDGLMMPIDKFNGIAKTVSNSLILYEEATIFFSNKGDVEDIRYLLVSRRHRNNTIIFTFHSLQQVPLNIMILCDLMVLFKTNDNFSLVKKKFESNEAIYHGFMDIKYNPRGQFDKRLIPLNL